MHLVVFSHLRWDFVHQRPQHRLSRLSTTWPVVFVEEPVRTEDGAHLEERVPRAGVRVLKPYTPVRAQGFHDDQLPVLKTLVDGWIESHRVDEHAVWSRVAPHSWDETALTMHDALERVLAAHPRDEPAGAAHAVAGQRSA